MSGPSTLAPDLKYRLLLEISQKISRTLDLPSVLKHLLESVRSVIAYDAAGIFVLNRSVPLTPEPEEFLIAGMATVGFGQAPRQDDPMRRSGKGIVGHVVRTGETVIAPDVSVDRHYVVARETTRSEMCVPVVSNDQIIGALNLESDRLGAFSAADAELLAFFASAAALSIEKAMLHRQVLDKQRLEHQLRIARDVQASLLPAGPPRLPGYDIAAINLPTGEIGGDYYDYIPLAGGRLGLVVADVSGKGVPAALIMAGLRAALRAELRRRREIHGVVEELNRVLLESAEGSARFVTAVYGIFDPGRGSFRYVNCGHNPPLLLRAQGGREELDTGGAALGIFPDIRFESATVTLEPGDSLALYTDGVVELTDSGQAEFAVDGLERALRRSAGLPAEEMIRAVVERTRAFAGKDSYEDDFTLVVVKRANGV